MTRDERIRRRKAEAAPKLPPEGESYLVTTPTGVTTATTTAAEPSAPKRPKNTPKSRDQRQKGRYPDGTKGEVVYYSGKWRVNMVVPLDPYPLCIEAEHEGIHQALELLWGRYLEATKGTE